MESLSWVHTPFSSGHDHSPIIWIDLALFWLCTNCCKTFADVHRCTVSLSASTGMTQSGYLLSFTAFGCRSKNLLPSEKKKQKRRGWHAAIFPKQLGLPSDSAHIYLWPYSVDSQNFRPATGCSPSRTTRYRHRHRHLLRRSDAFSTSAKGHRRPWKICNPRPTRGTMWLFHCASEMETWIRIGSFRGGWPEKNCYIVDHDKLGSPTEAEKFVRHPRSDKDGA